MDNRIVVTGIGVVSPLGMGRELFWSGINEGKKAFKPVTLFDTSQMLAKNAGEISDFKPVDIIGRKELVDMDRATTLLLCAAKYAVEDGKLEINEGNSQKIGISVGTTFGSLKSLSDFQKESIVDGPRFVNPSRFPNTVMNSPAGRVAIRHGIKGFNSTISTGMCASFDALDYGINALQTDRAQSVLVGAVEELCVQTFTGFSRMDYLAAIPPDSLPFDDRRNGIVFSEGACVLIIETLGSALNRRAPIYGEILSMASNYEAYHLCKYGNGDKGMAGAMRSALKKSAVALEEVDCVFANANSTIVADVAEAKAINLTFERNVPVAPVKSMIGESLSASGLMVLTAALGSIAKGVIPPNAGYKTKDTMCSLEGLSAVPRRQDVNTVIINAFSPHGSNASVVLRKFKGENINA